MLRILLHSLLLCLAAALTGCSHPAAFAPGRELPMGSAVAVLPVDSKDPISRERIEFFQSALTRGLESSGFQSVSAALVRSICRDAQCENRGEIARRVPGVTFVSLTIDSISRVNLLAAYYNSISGTLRFTDEHDAELLAITHTEGERGGLVFNTGQVIQGFTETISNAQGAGKDSLAERFLRILVEKIPKPASAAAMAGLQTVPKIRSTKVTPQGFTSAVCVEGDPGNSAALVHGRARATLAELSSGRYCGVVPARFLEGTTPQLELTSPVGQRARVDLPLPVTHPCEYRKKVEREDNRLYFNCAEGKCIECPGESYVVFRSPSLRGPFKRVGPLPLSGWKDPTNSAQPPYFAVLHRDPAGESGAPVVFPPTALAESK